MSTRLSLFASNGGARARGAAMVLSLVWLSGPLIRAQENPSPQAEGTLKVTTSVVNVFAVVKDHGGHLVPDLNKDDFEVTENNDPQTIRYFSREADTPLTMGILVDTSPSQERVLPLEQQEAKAFVRQVVRPKDMAFVLHFDSEVELLQDFTSDTTRLARAIDETTIGGGGGGALPGTFPGASVGGTHLYDAVYLASTDPLKNEIGRKVIIVLTDGVDEGSTEKLNRALEVAQRADTIIYAINISDRMFYFSRGMGYNGESVLRKLSDDTGGRVIDVSRQKDLSEAFAEIARELRTQYLLGYSSTNTRRDGSYRKIRVRVRNGDYKIQARRGYYAPTS
jgi:VWFA-related protein